MAKVTARFMEREIHKKDAVTASNIAYSADETIKDAIDRLNKGLDVLSKQDLLALQLFKSLSHLFRPINITFNPNKGPQHGDEAGKLLEAEYDGQIVRQWSSDQICLIWMAIESGDATNWCKIGEHVIK